MKHLLWILALLPSTGFSGIDSTRVANIRASSPACESKISVHEAIDGSIEISLNDLRVTRGDNRPFVRCRLLSDIHIPAGQKPSKDVQLSAKVRGHFETRGDQVGAKLHVSISDQRSSDFQAIRQANEIANESGENHDLHMHVTFPEVRISDVDRTLALSIQLEGMINYRLDQLSKVSAELASIQIPIITLTRGDSTKREP